LTTHSVSLTVDCWLIDS